MVAKWVSCCPSLGNELRLTFCRRGGCGRICPLFLSPSFHVTGSLLLGGKCWMRVGCVWEAVMAVLLRPFSVISMSFCGELLLVLVLQELGVCSEGALNFVYSKTINSFDILFFTRLLWLWLFLMSHEMAIGNPLILLPTRVCNFRSNHFVADVNFVMRNTRFMTAGFLTDCFIA